MPDCVLLLVQAALMARGGRHARPGLRRVDWKTQDGLEVYWEAPADFFRVFSVSIRVSFRVLGQPSGSTLLREVSLRSLLRQVEGYMPNIDYETISSKENRRDLVQSSVRDHSSP